MIWGCMEILRKCVLRCIKLLFLVDAAIFFMRVFSRFRNHRMNTEMSTSCFYVVLDFPFVGTDDHSRYPNTLLRSGTVSYAIGRHPPNLRKTLRRALASLATPHRLCGRLLGSVFPRVGAATLARPSVHSVVALAGFRGRGHSDASEPRILPQVRQVPSEFGLACVQQYDDA